MNTIQLTHWYKQVFTHSSEGIWIIDQNENTLITNPSLAKILHVPAEEWNNFDVKSFIPPINNERFYLDLIQNDTILDPVLPYHLKLKSGIKIWVEVNSTAIELAPNQTGKIYFFKDITNSKKLEKNQMENLRMYFSLFEDSPVPIWDEDFSELKKWVDQKKNEGIQDFREYLNQNPNEIDFAAGKMIINKINKAVVKLNEANSKEEVLKNLNNLRTNDFANIIIKQIESIAQGETSCEFDAVLKTINGNIRHVLFKWTVVKGYESNYGKIYLTTTDLTNRIVEDNLRLQQSNRDKEILLREIHHRVKNNFQIISSLIRLQSNALENENLEGAMTILLNRIYAMAAVHELLYRSEKMEVINLDEYLNHLAQLLIDSLQITAKVKFEIKSEPLTITLDQASPFGLIINEIITNSVKHGFQGIPDGKLYIHAFSKADRIIIEIGDDGKGITKKNENTDSLGLALVESLVEQLNGTLIQIDKKFGVHFQLSIPNIPIVNE